MLVENAQCAPLTVALARTFDGAHPCNVCRVVAEGTKTQKESKLLSVVTKIDLLCPDAPRKYVPPAAPHDFAELIVETIARSEAPPVPPPRSLVG